MAIRSILFDFYGTIVHEDDLIITSICERIASHTQGATPKEIGAFWAKDFTSAYASSFGDNFETQRALETASIERLLAQYGLDIPVREIDAALYEYWQRPQIFEDAIHALKELEHLPICIVSNIDRNDIDAAVAFHDLQFDAIVTSQDARSYKPRYEIFDLALQTVGASADEVLMVGDSLSSDIAGAQAAGIKAVWINRKVKQAGQMIPEFEITSLAHLPTINSSVI